MDVAVESGLLRGPLKTPTRPVMAATYEKQGWLDKFLVPVPIQEAFEPLSVETGMDIFDFYAKNYVVKPTRKNVPQEQVLTKLSESGSEYNDVKPFFKDQNGRRYYRYIESRYHPEKRVEDCRDLLFVEEALPKGKILAIFEYNDPYDFPIETNNGKRKIFYRKLKACYAIVPAQRREEDKVIDLTSFWTGAQSKKSGFNDVWKEAREKAKVKRKFPEVASEQIVDNTRIAKLPEENRAVSIGIVSQAPDLPVIDIVTQMNLLKEKGRLLIADEAGPEKWYQLIYLASSFSQNEGDKMEGKIRSDLPLGVIRSMLGETGEAENNAIDQFLTSAARQGTDLRNILQETQDWFRNRLAASLYLVRKLHNFGIHFVPEGQYQDMFTWIQSRLSQLQGRESKFQS